MSRLGDGRFYLIEDASRLPAVFAQETVFAAKSSINEVVFNAAAGAPARRSAASTGARRPSSAATW